MSNKDSYKDMLAAVQAFHDKHDFKNTGGEELAYRVALMTEELGEISACVTKGKDKIVGATIVAKHAGEMISEISVAMAAGMGLGALASVIHPYPTQAEAIRQLGDAYNRTRLTPGVKRLFQRYLALTR